MRLIGWIAVIAAMAPAAANDSSAELAAGGLVLTRNDAVAMLAENLFISREAVRVHEERIDYILTTAATGPGRPATSAW